VRVLKRRGPPLERALLLELPPVLSASARARALARRHEPALQPATFIDLGTTCDARLVA
jgi:hypothetical protein